MKGRVWACIPTDSETAGSAARCFPGRCFPSHGCVFVVTFNYQFPLLIRMSTRAAQFIESARLDRWGAVRVCVFASCQSIVLQG
jgi:hypothetical protein